MLIGLCGGICAGKHSVAKYLVDNEGFTILYLDRDEAVLPGIRAPQRLHYCEIEDHQQRSFETADSLLDFVTRRWQQRWVTFDVCDEDALEKFVRRPFFVLISIDAPISVRWKRFAERLVKPNALQKLNGKSFDDDYRCASRGSNPPSLEEFILQNDSQLYREKNGLAWMVDRAEIRLINQSRSLEELYKALKELKIADNERQRPGWDQYFMQLASLAAQRSNCMKRRVGCVLVREKRVISTGYNGTPRNLKNCNEGGCVRCNSGHGAGLSLSTCLCLHAEENALLEAGRERIRENSTLYCDTCPCLTCSIKIVQVGISEVVYSESYAMDKEAAMIFAEAHVKLRKFLPPQKGIMRLK